MPFGFGTEFGRQRPSSPIATDEERAVFEENEKSLRTAVENAMRKRKVTNGSLFIHSHGSSYTLQKHYVAESLHELKETVRQHGIEPNIPCVGFDYNLGVSSWRAVVSPNVWEGFAF